MSHPSVLSRRPRRVRPALAGILVALAAAAPAASAADAPFRTISTSPVGPVAVSADGREIVAGDQASNAPVLIDTATGKATPVSLSRNALWTGSVSRDQRRFPYVVSAPNAIAATRGVYVQDHRDGGRTFVSVSRFGPAGWTTTPSSPFISGDGNVVRFSAESDPPAGSSATSVSSSWSYDLAADRLTKLDDGIPMSSSTDDAGRVHVNRAGVGIDARRWPLPAGVDGEAAKVSPDGSAVAWWSGPTVTVLATATGAVRTATVPAAQRASTAYHPRVLGVANGGATLTLGVSARRGSVDRSTIGSFAMGSGTWTQLGGDVTYFGPELAISGNAAFAATPYALHQLGSQPLPGGGSGGPTVPRIAPENLVMGCDTCYSSAFFGFKNWKNALVVFSAPTTVAGRPDATRLEAVVRQGAKSWTLPTLTPNQQTSFAASREGLGYVIEGRVTYSDGYVGTFTKQVVGSGPRSCSL